MPQHDDLLPADIKAITTGLLRLSQQIDRAECPADIAAVLTPIVDRHDGVLRRLTQIFEAIGDICNDFVLQDRYAVELQADSDEAFSALGNLLTRVNGLDEDFRTFSPDVTRTPPGRRPSLVSQDSLSPDGPTAPNPLRIRQATHTLAELKNYFRTHPSLDQALPLLSCLLDEDEGIPILLGDILRASTHIVNQHFDHPRSDAVRQAVEALRAAAQEATDWHVLHWDVQRLQTQVGAHGADASGR